MDIAVVVNLRARRGSQRVARACREALPGAHVVATSHLDELYEVTDSLRRAPPELIVSAGGDGTAVTLLSALRADPLPIIEPPLAVVPLGTGNAMATTLGSPRWRAAFRRLGDFRAEAAQLPLQRLPLVEVEGKYAPFAGAGWDSIILSDYARIKQTTWLPKVIREGKPGYLLGVAARSIPLNIGADPIEVEVINLGSEAIVIDDAGRPARMPGAGPGTVLYRGPMSVSGCGTTRDFGFRFRAFPFAGSVPLRFCARVYGGSVGQVLRWIPDIWRGKHPVPSNHVWMLDHCKMIFSRPVPFQVGGDIVGMRTEIEYKLAADPVDLVDWRALHKMERDGDPAFLN